MRLTIARFTKLTLLRALASFVIMQHVLILHCMYVLMSVTLEPWGVPSDIIRKHRIRVAWLHGLRAWRVVTWFTYSGISPSPSPTTCGQIRELQRCSVSSNYILGNTT